MSKEEIEMRIAAIKGTIVSLSKPIKPLEKELAELESSLKK